MTRGRPVRTLVAATTIALTLGTGPVRAETTGDLYVASAAGILEVVSASATILDNVPISPSPVSIAIRPDGRELFALDGGRQVIGVDLESMAIASHLDLPAPGAAIAYPRGDQLVIALPSLRRLASIEAGSDRLIQSEPLPGAVDLLSADRRDGRVLAAARGGHWVAVFDPGSGSVRSTTISGTVAAISFDASAGSLIAAITHPNRVVALDLRDFSTRWTMSLSSAPRAVAVAGTTTLVAVGRAVWAVDHAASPGVTALGVSTAEPTGRRWRTLAKTAAALSVSDDASFVYALEADRVEGFAMEQSGHDSAASAMTRTVRLIGARAPVAIVVVPGAQPLLGGPGVATAAPRAEATRGTAPAGGVTPRTDTILDATGWAGARAIVPGAILVGLVILVAGLLAVRRYERGDREPVRLRTPARRPGSPGTRPPA